MRLTIERIRTLVLVAAVLLVGAIGTFLGISKFSRPFSSRDIPKRLGIDIQQEANGVTYTQAHGGHTIFKIHASRVVQLRSNRATLYDVVIELYGKDGARVDRIRGTEFEYDQQSAIATASGLVVIELARPTLATMPPPPGAKPRKPNPNDTIQVKTSGITFNQSTGIVTTAQHVEFTSGQGSGSALGASYDSGLGFLVLNRDVELTTFRSGNSVTIHAAHAEFNRDEQICMLREATAQSRSEQATAAEARVSFRPDGTVEQLNAFNGLTISAQAGSHLAAPTGNLEFTQKSQPRHAHLEGGVVMDSTSGGRTLHGTAATMDLDFTTGGYLRHAHLEHGVEMQSRETQTEIPQAAGGPTQIFRVWHSPVADVDFRSAGSGQVEPASLHGLQGVVLTSETRRPGTAPVPQRLAADDLTAQFGPRSTLTSMSGAGHASLDQVAATGAHQTATGDRLEAHFTTLPQPAGQQKIQPANAKANPAAAPQLAQLQTAQLDGHVLLIDQPAQKPGQPAAKPGAPSQPQPPIRATAGRAFYEAANTSAQTQEQWLHLTINPRVTNGGLGLTADKIDVEQSSGDAFARGNVKATWVNENPSAASSSNATPQPVALGGTSPAHVIAVEALLHQSTGEATFRGHARLWQDQNSISAPVIVLNRQQQTLTAQAAGAAQPVLSVLLSASTNPSGAPQPSAAAKSPSQPSVIRVRSGDLRYSAEDRKAILRAAPLATVTTQTGAVESTSDQLELYLVPATAQRTPSPASNPAAPSQVDRVVALGHVVLTSQGRRGTGTQLVYTAQTGNYVLTGTPAARPRMTDPQRGSVTGESLLFSSRDDSVSIEGGTQPTTTQTTAPR